MSIKRGIQTFCTQWYHIVSISKSCVSYKDILMVYCMGPNNKMYFHKRVCAFSMPFYHYHTSPLSYCNSPTHKQAFTLILVSKGHMRETRESNRFPWPTPGLVLIYLPTDTGSSWEAEFLLQSYEKNHNQTATDVSAWPDDLHGFNIINIIANIAININAQAFRLCLYLNMSSFSCNFRV